MRFGSLSRAAALSLALLGTGAAIAQSPAVHARFGHAIVLKSDGTLASWGNDSDGQLGSGRVLVDPVPTRLPNVPPLAQVASSREHVVALDKNGRVWTWGTETRGRLGVRTQRDHAKPGRVQGIQEVVAVAASDFGSFAVKSDGTVWMWGGALACWAGQDSPEPRQIAGLSGIVQISAGQDHLVMLTRGATVVTLGSNFEGVAGDGTVQDRNTCVPRSPVSVQGLADVVHVNAGSFSAHAVTADGKLYSWGQLWGAADPGPIVPSPTLITRFPKPVRRVAVRQQMYALLDDGTVWSWTSYGGPSGNVSQVPGLASIAEIAAPTFFNQTVLARDSSGRLFVWSQNSFGESGIDLAYTATAATRQVPLPDPVLTMSAGFYGIVAITSEGKAWTWGRDGLGLLGRGTLTSNAVPRAVGGIANVRKLAVGSNNTFALDASGRVWGWGNNNNRQLGTTSQTPSSVPVLVPGFGNVVDIAASWNAVLALGTDGKVRTSGPLTSLPEVGSPIAGLPAVARMGAGWEHAFFITASGDLWALGNNAFGQLGDGTTTNRATPVKIAGLPAVTQVVSEFSYTLALTAGGEVWAWGRNIPGLGDSPSSVPQRVPGLSGIVEIAADNGHGLARQGDGTVYSWAQVPRSALGRDGNAATPLPVEGLDQVISIAAADGASYAVRADGSVWGWGGVKCGSDACPLPGDGTYVERLRPVVVIREDGKGNLDTSDWFLDAKPGTPKTIPAAKVPKAVAFANALSSSGLLNVDATVNVRQSDQSKTLGLYVTGLVPAAFLKQVPVTVGTEKKLEAMKADQMVLVNLTPSGWTVASGQLEALSTGVGNAALGASSLLVNVNPTTIPGARFCIGYGESATDMLKTGTVRDFLALEGAGASVDGLPCLLSGVYVDGPHTSPKGTAVPLRAVVVGKSPTGSVRFREGFADISADVALTPVNAAVSDASVSYTPPAVGEYAFGAAYGGDANNAAVTSEIPLRHVVQAVRSASTVAIDAPVSSEVGMELRLIAAVGGNRPGGTVQFKRGGVNEGAPVPVVDDQAVTTVVGLGIGEYSFTAEYSGDANNSASTSAAFVHTVLDVATSSVALGSSGKALAAGSAVTFTVTVSGTSPAGTVKLRRGTEGLGTASLNNGTASFTLPALSAGVHVFAADYSGDAKNPAASSNALFQQVALAAPVRLGNIATRAPVLTGDHVMIGGFVIQGSSPKKVLVTARGPSMAAQGLTGTLANPVLTLYAGATPIASNDDWQTNANATEITATGFGPGNPLESALLVTLNPGPYTAIVTGANGSTGIGIVEAFEVDRPDVQLVNIATRAPVLTGDNVMIGGFIIQGSTPKTVLVTARGPSLAAQGVPGVLANPVLTLYSGATPIASNDDWESNANAAAIRATGVAPSNPQESALLMTLNPGAYTAIVTGANGTTGIGIVEVFAQ